MPDKPARDERLSLAGLDPEEVPKALLKVDPDSEPVEGESPRKKQDKSDPGKPGKG
jgi:hypothetical protein